jgi:hypothetical protein
MGMQPGRIARLFSAWDGVFNEKQLNEIIRMSRHATNNGQMLHDALMSFAPAIKKVERKLPKISMPRCPDCGKILKLSEIARGSDRYKEGYRVYLLCGAACCTGKGCGWEIFSKKTIDEILKSKLF